MSGDAPVPKPPPGRLGDVLGFEITEFDDERVVGSFEVTDAVRQPFGIVHGGAYAAMAESMASVATYFAVASDGSIAVGQNNDTSFLRPVSEGTVSATATRRHRGRTSWIWDVEFSDGDGRPCALGRVTIAVRPNPAG